MVAVPSPGWWRSSDRAGGLRVRVLIAEDDPVSRTILRHVVEKFGHECLVAEDGVRAWELYRSTPSVNVVISDWMMPGMDGLELCRMVRRENRDEYTYFMFLTALGDREHLLTGLEAGADDYLAKPLDRAELQMRLVAASRVTSLHRQLTEQKAELVQRSRQAALGEYVSVALIESGSLPVILRRCAEAIVQHLDAACVRIWTFNDEDGILELQAGAGVSCFPDGPLDRVAVGESDIGLVARERRPRWTNDLLNAPWMSGKDWARRIGVVAFAGHPLTVEGRLVGVLGAFAREPLGEDAFKTLASVADTMAQGIERKRVERQLRHQLDFTRAITDSLSSGLLALDAKGRVTFMNPAAERMLGSTESESLGKGIREVVSPAHADASPPGEHPLLESMRTGWTLRVDDDSFGRKDGTVFPVAYTASPIFEDGQVVGSVMAFQDMTKLREVEEMKQQFVSTVSHELRTPLTSIRGYLEALIEDEAGPLNEEQREYAEISYRNAKRLEMLVGDLLTVSRLDSGRLNMNVERIEIDRVLRQLEEEFRPIAEDKGLALSVTAVSGLAVNGDRLRTVQVLSNLISNAIKFSHSGRDVRVGVRRSGEQVIVEVTDQGVGIPASELPRLTERFFRASTARDVQGTGLGLSISKEIVERQGGRLEIESEEGTGSTFRVMLPAAE